MSVVVMHCVVTCSFLIPMIWASPAQPLGGTAGSEAEKLYAEGVEAWDQAVALADELKQRLAELGEDEGSDKAGDKPGQEEGDPLEKPDFSGAFDLFKRSADAGYGKAAVKISELLLAGDGVPKDTAGSFEWALKAAEMGDVEGQLLAASKYEEGRGAKKSLSRALALYEQALEQGATAARMKVADLLDRGEPGVEQNRARALPLFQGAAQDGDPGAIYMIGLYLQRGYVVAKDDRAASQWYLRAAELGEARAQRKLAMRYFRGTGVEQDPIEALKWCEIALKNPDGDVETKNLAREYQEAIRASVTPRKADQAMREVGRFKLKEFEEISLPPLPYDGPALVYHQLSDTNGNRLEAAIVALKADAVILERRSDGSRFTVPLKRLSEESRKLVQLEK